MIPIQEMIAKAYEEDIPKGDITTQSLELASKQGYAKLMAKEDLILSASEVFEKCILYIEPEAKIRWHFIDGDKVYESQCICEIEGNLLKILAAERVALNFIGYFSGIASYTHCFVERVKHTQCKILDTRKTLPLYRKWVKKAVYDGGGMNHRFTLSDMVLVKENHIRAFGGFRECIQQIKKVSGNQIEVECSSLEEIKIAVEEKVQRIMLDNMDNEQLAEALKQIPASIITEASGNMKLDRVQSVAELGLHFISVGALTHSAPNADMSLLFQWEIQ